MIRHRSDEERSGCYDKLLECEELAKSSKRGLHGTKQPPPNRVNDVSAPGNATKWVQAARESGHPENPLSPLSPSLLLPCPSCSPSSPPHRAKQYLPFFQRAGRMLAQVDYVLSGHRLK